MNKKEAAEYLGFTVKNLERYMAQKKIGFQHVKGKFGNEVNFNKEELDRFKIGLAQDKVVISPAIASENSSTSLTSTTISNDSIANLTNEFRLTLQDFYQRLLEQNQQVSLSLGEKLTLSLVEASQLAGLSQGWLRKAIKDNKLKAAKRGKGWNIKRADLETYVKEL